MAPWAYKGKRVDDVKPSFDIFPLAKVMWSMISGQRYLPFWDHRDPEFDLTVMFPNDPTMYAANLILDRCLVRYEADCLPSASALLNMVDEFLKMLGKGGQLLGKGVPRPCQVCGLGQYRLDEGRFQRIGNPPQQIYCCDHCDHMQFFGGAKEFEPDPSENRPPPMPRVR